MLRMFLFFTVLVAPITGSVQENAREKKEPKTRPSYVGVMIALGKGGEVVVLQAVADGPAQKAGVQAGDVLVRINGVQPKDLKTAVSLIKAMTPGKKSKFEIEREGKSRTLDVVPDPIGD